MAKSNDTKAIENLVKGLSGAGITATAELIKKVKPKIDEKKKNKERKRTGVPRKERVGLNQGTKGVNTNNNGGKLK